MLNNDKWVENCAIIEKRLLSKGGLTNKRERALIEYALFEVRTKRGIAILIFVDDYFS